MLSLVLPARNWPRDRLEACIGSFLRLKSRTLSEIVVVDFGSDRPISVGIRDKRVRTVRVDADRWSLAEAINVGVMASANRIVAKTDADIVVARESGPGLDAAVAAIAEGKLAVGVVQAIDLPQGIDAASALKAKTDLLIREGRLRARWGQGGLCIFSADAWNEVGGFDARFHGWGNEDNDFVDRIRRASGRMRWIADVRIFHVWHPPSYLAKDVTKARSSNRQLYAEDKSTFRAMLFPQTSRSSLSMPNLVNRPRPLVTIGIASRARPGRERMLTEALRRFAGQIDNDFEVVIADNGSTPEQTATLRQAIARLPRSLKTRVVEAARPSIPAARNLITDEALGRYVCVADDDDLPLPGRLADHLACFVADPAIHGSHGGWIDFDEKTGVIDRNTGGDRKLETMLFGRGKVTAHPASFYRRDVMRAVRYDEIYSVGSDLDLAVRMASLGLRIAHTGTYVTLRRFHDANVTITDQHGQVAVGVECRQRVTDTLGAVYEQRLREAGKAAAPNVACRNELDKDAVIALLPGYVGVWRLLLPLAELGRTASPEVAAGADAAPIEVNGGGRSRALNGSPDDPVPVRTGLAERAAELAAMIEGDVRIVDSGIDPGLYFVSDPVRGAKRALGLRDALEQRFDLAVDMIPDVEYERRRTSRFDWSTLAVETQAGRLVSKPIKQLDRALAALGRVPANTALRAMTSILADFNCTEHRFHLITTPIRAAEGPRRVKRTLEQQTGESFRLLGEPEAGNLGGRSS